MGYIDIRRKVHSCTDIYMGYIPISSVSWHQRLLKAPRGLNDARGGVLCIDKVLVSAAEDGNGQFDPVLQGIEQHIPGHSGAKDQQEELPKAHEDFRARSHFWHLKALQTS